METAEIIAPQEMLKKQPPEVEIKIAQSVVEVKKPRKLKEPKKIVSKAKRIAREIDTNKGKGKASAANRLQKILALWVVALRQWLDHVWGNYVQKGARAVRRLLKRIGSFLLGLFNLDSSDKIDDLLSKTKEVAKSSGQQALAAALMALLTSLAEGARVAMSELIKDGGSKILQAIVEGASESFAETPRSQPTLFDQQRQTVQASPFKNQYATAGGYDSSIPPWAR